jgi:hypothetical protein
MRYDRAAMRWLERFMNERRPPLAEVALAASALAELRHGRGKVGSETLKRFASRQHCPTPFSLSGLPLSFGRCLI